MRELVSIHAPAKGATSPRCGDGRQVVFQSTLPRRERRGLAGAAQAAGHGVSIHAPAKGATAISAKNSF